PLTATISAVAPGAGTRTGTVTFMEGATTFCLDTTLFRSATFSTSSLSLGNHSITAVYNGASSFNASTSATLTQTVNKANTTTALSSSLNPTTFSQAVTFTAAVSVVAPGVGPATGTFTFKD